MQLLSKTTWYKKFKFLTWQQTSKVKSKLNTHSFQKLIGTICGFSKLDLTGSTKVLVIAKVLCQQRSYTYLSTQNKFTILKPKFNLLFPLKSVLLFRHQLLTNIVSLYISKIKGLISRLSFLSLKWTYKAYPTKKYLTSKIFFKLKPLVLNKYFFLVHVFPLLFSTFQQKINFFQFKIFLKKLL